ncbi:polysaccharide pyruvyl transferase family protein [Streptomyces corynorhini]|uniref:Polysaccharide pyruvyl transferase family protein n=1 Tax=Streptomyces corynorhini TaxID=2282652 RepID=A0A370BK58_9ACTN|nr:polysaccharide pyruvyl transferase family protein [Streptomyces corynorhini]RDG39996.1 polysaccharide pyruvyl transferase family protein [Streptomyces corynorhini]
MKRILIRSGKSPFRVATREEFIQQDLIGTNSGNLLFSDAAHKILLTDRTEVTSNGLRTDSSAKRSQQINEEYDVFVVPLANAFRPTFRPALDRLSALIEQLTIPVVVLGVGAQAGDDYDTERLQAIEPSVKRFMRAVLERSASVGVRGELTASYLRELGFREVETIGCPSMFLHGDTFPRPRDPAPFSADSRIAINLSAQANRVGDLVGLARNAHERFPLLTYYAQNLVDAETLFWGDTSAASGDHDALPRRLTHPLLRENKVRVPLDPRTWLDELSTYDFSYGTRIHGNIAALLAGTPAVVLAHDSRTLELCRYFGIPHRMLAGLPADIHPEELYTQADFGGLLDGHKERFDRFTAFLDKNSLENTFTHGDGGAAFEARLNALDLPPSVEVWDGSDDGALRYRISRLREQLVENRALADRHITTLTKTNKELQKQLAKMQKQLTATEKRIAGIEKRAAIRVGSAIRRRIGKVRPSA